MKNNAMHQLTYGLYVLTARDGEKDNGCIINTAGQVTTTPNQIVVTVNKGNLTHDMIMKTGQFNVSVLTEKASFQTFTNFGFQSGRTAEKFAQITYERMENGIAYLTNETNAAISAKVNHSVDLGTHTMFIADVTEERTLADDDSVTYSYYQSHIKPAPKSKKTGWICTICGYIYEGEELPKDFECPICKHGAADFVKQN